MFLPIIMKLLFTKYSNIYVWNFCLFFAHLLDSDGKILGRIEEQEEEVNTTLIPAEIFCILNLMYVYLLLPSHAISLTICNNFIWTDFGKYIATKSFVLIPILFQIKMFFWQVSDGDFTFWLRFYCMCPLLALSVVSLSP